MCKYNAFKTLRIWAPMIWSRTALRWDWSYWSHPWQSNFCNISEEDQMWHQDFQASSCRMTHELQTATLVSNLANAQDLRLEFTAHSRLCLLSWLPRTDLSRWLACSPALPLVSQPRLSWYWPSFGPLWFTTDLSFPPVPIRFPCIPRPQYTQRSFWQLSKIYYGLLV